MTLTILPTDPGANELSRRTFLQGVSAVLGAGALGGSAATLLSEQDAWAAFGDPLPADTPILVVVELNGGNDPHNTLVPMSVPWTTGYYRGSRPTLGITSMTSARPYAAPPAGVALPPALELRDGWGLHGALPWIANRWHLFGDVAIVQGVGERVKREQSHFASAAFRAAAAFSGPNLATGWLGRYNDANNPGHALGAVSTIGAQEAFVSNASPSVSISSLSSFAFGVNNIPDSSTWLAKFRDLGATAPSAVNKAGVAQKAIADAFGAMDRAQSITAFPAGGQGGSLAQQLSVVASLIHAGVPCQTYMAGLGGFDHHGSQAADHLNLLRRLDVGLANLFSLLNQTSRSRDVVVLVMSEFGRRVTQNGSSGTDHGLAQHMFVIGGRVRGGFYGTHPSIKPEDRVHDAMDAAIDFRSVYATLLNRLGGDTGLTEAVLGRDESNQPFADLGLWTGPAPAPPAGADAGSDDAAAGASGGSATDPSSTTTAPPEVASSSTTSPTTPPTTSPSTPSTTAPSTSTPSTTTPTSTPSSATTSTTVAIDTRL